jgi:hypothetical protein
MFSTMRSAAVLAIGGLLATAVVATAAEPVEVTGTSSCFQTVDGETPPGLTGPDFRNSVYSCSFDVSDDRMTGDAETVNNCDFSVDGETTVGNCWGTSVLQNDGGAWAGVFSGTTSWSDSEPTHIHEIDLVYLGAGGYDGLQFTGTFTGADYPWAVTATIGSAE